MSSCVSAPVTWAVKASRWGVPAGRVASSRDSHDHQPPSSQDLILLQADSNNTHIVVAHRLLHALIEDHGGNHVGCGVMRGVELARASAQSTWHSSAPVYSADRGVASTWPAALAGLYQVKCQKNSPSTVRSGGLASCNDADSEDHRQVVHSVVHTYCQAYKSYSTGARGLLPKGSSRCMLLPTCVL